MNEILKKMFVMKFHSHSEIRENENISAFIFEGENHDVLALSDGVGGWRSHGVDPSKFSFGLLIELVVSGHGGEACRGVVDCCGIIFGWYGIIFGWCEIIFGSFGKTGGVCG